ncbi:MAG TPA: PPOX class F420-dependent oxidoreductase [Candidatus Dormibacteraeota bacterium]|nr:PPOX class F420-dependent oxidoreductase [Candidatus Dormibacteraeota bacterium]
MTKEPRCRRGFLLSQFVGRRYIALETFKRDGEGVRTPVWFVEQGGKLYVWTIGESGKVKRIRNNPRVRVNPSSVRGKPKGNWIEAKASLIGPEASALFTDLIRRKYGFQFWIVNHLHAGIRRRVVVEIEPANSPR